MTAQARVRARLLAAVLALSASACQQPTTEEVVSEAPVSVRTVTVTRDTIEGVIHATGVVTPAPGAELVVVAPETARIIELPAGVGDRVHRGDVLVHFEVPGATAEVQRQAAEIARAEAAVAAATSARTRAEELFDRGVGARKDLEEHTRTLADAEAALAQARAARTAALAVSERTVVRATFDGVVVKRAHNPGDVVEAAAGDPVLRIVDPRRLEVTAAVPLADVLRLRVGASARLSGVSASGVEPGVQLTVLSRPAAVEPGAASVNVRLAFAAPVDLPAGLPVQLDIAAEEHRDVVVVPAAAVVREGDETAVFVAHDGKAARRAVTLGMTDGRRVEIADGLAAGDEVIVDGQAGLPDATPITVRTEGDGRP